METRSSFIITFLWHFSRIRPGVLGYYSDGACIEETTACTEWGGLNLDNRIIYGMRMNGNKQKKEANKENNNHKRGGSDYINKLRRRMNE